MTYNYYQAVRDDITGYINDRCNIADFEDADSAFDMLHDDVWMSDDVTGNASGSYTFNTYKAEENLLHNWDLIEEAAEAFGDEPIISCGYRHSAEYWDVTIRCYLVDILLYEVIEDLMR